MTFVYSDGGRAAAGYKGSTGDCVCRAIAIATELPYQSVYDIITLAAGQERRSRRRRGTSGARKGVYRPTTKRIMAALGWTWVPAMFIDSGCKVHLDARELPAGRLVVSVSKHLCAVIDGVLYDTHDCSREGTRCVYGYWYKAE